MLDRSVMDLGFIDKLGEDKDYIEEVSPDFWLMDDHRWAYYVWEKIRGKNEERYALAHLDFHYDGVNDFQDQHALDRLVKIASLGELFDLVKDGKCVRYDSFIAPAIIRGIIAEVHLFCCQSEEDTDRGIDDDILSLYGCQQFFYHSSEELVAGVRHTPLLFDLCLDLFNKDEGRIIRRHSLGRLRNPSLIEYMPSVTEFGSRNHGLDVIRLFGH